MIFSKNTFNFTLIFIIFFKSLLQIDIFFSLTIGFSISSLIDI